MATGDRKQFALGGEEYEVAVIGPYGGEDKAPWWKLWHRPEPPLFELVTITRLDPGAGKPLKALVYRDSLPQMTREEFARRLERTEEIDARPSGAKAIVLMRDGEQIVMSRGEWNSILLTAFISGWERAVPSEAPMPDDEAADLLSVFEQILEQVPREKLIEQHLMPPDGFIEFLRGGGFEIRGIE